MKFLPNPGLPDALYRLLTFSDYTRGNAKYSSTDLIKPPQIVQLGRRHPDIEQDCRDSIYAVLGSAVHARLEWISKLNPIENEIAEERLFLDIDGISISGQPDVYCVLHNGLLTDYKTTKVGALSYGIKEEWIPQLNIYSYMLRRHGRQVERAQVMIIFRDWTPTRYHTAEIDLGGTITLTPSSRYPEKGVVALDIPMWSDEETLAYIRERIALHEAAAALADSKLPDCSNDERWRNDTKWFVRKVGNARGKSLASKELAEEWIAEQKSGEYTITERPGIPLRCLYFCQSRSACHQLKRENFKVSIAKAA